MCPQLYVGVRNIVEQVFLVRVKLKQEHEQGFAVPIFNDDFYFLEEEFESILAGLFAFIVFLFWLKWEERQENQ